MNQTEIDILNLENRILKDRGDLNNLIYQQRKNLSTDAMMNQKLQEMQREVEYLGEQLAWLKNSRIESVVPSGMTAQKQEQADSAWAVMSENVQAKMPVQQENVQMVQQPIRIQQAKTQNTHKSKDMESVIGKSWMGAIASVLIFISIIMFATLLLPVLTDTIKMIVMYIVSIAATIFGLLKLNKDKKNPFYLAVSGCGIGAIYISLLLTNMYFKAIGDVTLYLLIAVWAVFVCILSRQKSILFQVIGQCGILIAVVFGCALCDSTDDSTKFVILVFFYLITSLIFMWVHYQRELSGNLISLIFNHINAWIIFLIANYDFDAEKVTYIVAVLMMLYIAASITICFKVHYDKEVIGGVLLISNLFVFTQFMGMCLEDDFAVGVIKLGIAAVMIGITEWKFKDSQVMDKRIMQIAMMTLLGIAVRGMDVWAEELLLFIIGAAVLVYGYDRKDLAYHFGSLTMVMTVILTMDFSLLHYSVGVLYFVLLLVLSLWKKEQYHCGVKLYGYIGFFIVLWHTYEVVGLLPWENEAIHVTAMMILSVVHMIAMKTFGMKNFSTGEPERAGELVFGGLNALLMLVATAFVVDTEHAVWHLVSILIAGMLFMANSGNLLKRYQGKKEEMYAGIYVGLKLTVLLWVSLSSFDAANMIVSIACFVLAIIGIMIGFGMEFKSLRIYGLVLSIFSVVKLIMVDMSYDNLLGRAVGFFVCGILCFVISLIYNTIDKNMKKG
ncbi:MAG: DUF2339 domain-containing protein [Lachnospiraceae bacterium]|nr:DUF2339 domain-containing protein [Lachnospiraceae bacterium]